MPKNWTTQFCAGKDAIDCDVNKKGGALYVLENVSSKQKFVLAGFVSGPKCNKLDKYSIFTRTVAYLDWIKQNSDEL